MYLYIHEIMTINKQHINFFHKNQFFQNFIIDLIDIFIIMYIVIKYLYIAIRVSMFYNVLCETIYFVYILRENINTNDFI